MVGGVPMCYTCYLRGFEYDPAQPPYGLQEAFRAHPKPCSFCSANTPLPSVTACTKCGQMGCNEHITEHGTCYACWLKLNPGAVVTTFRL